MRFVAQIICPSSSTAHPSAAAASACCSAVGAPPIYGSGAPYPAPAATSTYVPRAATAGVRVRSRCVAAGVLSCQRVETLPLSSCCVLRGPPPASPFIGHGACTRMTPLGLAIVPCGSTYLVLGAVTHLDDCVCSGHYCRCVVAP